MKASLTYDLNNSKERKKYFAAVRVEQMGAIIKDAIELLDRAINERNNTDCEEIKYIRESMVEDIKDLDFDDLVFGGKLI